LAFDYTPNHQDDQGVWPVWCRSVMLARGRASDGILVIQPIERELELPDRPATVYSVISPAVAGLAGVNRFYDSCHSRLSFSPPVFAL